MTLPSSDVHRSHWFQHAATWEHFGPPLRPHPQDMAAVASVCAGSARRRATPLRALLLGVTPEYALLPWAAGTSLTAVDKCADMIAKVWPDEHLPDTFRALEGLWTSLPLADQSVDLAMGDGISTVLPHWADMQTILAELHRVCAPGATVLLRLFIKPASPDSLAQLMEDVEVGRLQGFHAFKLRLLMILQDTLAAGVKPAAAWATWHQLRGQHAACIASRRWPPREVATIEAYAGSKDTYWFPTEEEAMRAFAPWFTVREVRRADYELAERCPLFVLDRSA